MMKTYFFDLDDTLLKLNWPVFEKAYYGGLARAFSALISPEKTIDYIYQSYLYMVAVIDQRSNKEKFYAKMAELSGIEAKVLMAKENAYYENEYDKLQSITTKNETMVQALRRLQEKKYPIIIASQPVFPALATHKRLAWLGFDAAEFLKVTTFETERACKPSLAYYQNLLNEFNLQPADCVMVGNDRKEDMVATQLGMAGILIVDDILDSEDDFVCQEMTAQEFLAYVSSR